MARGVLRFAFLIAAFTWIAVPRTTIVHAQSENCNCHGIADGWAYPLVQPHCGHGTGDAWSYQPSDSACHSWCHDVAEQAGQEMCGHVCQDPNYGAHSYSYSACWVNYDTSFSGCFDSGGPVISCS